MMQEIILRVRTLCARSNYRCVKESLTVESYHAVMDIGKFKICRVGQQAGDSGKSQCFSSGPEAV